jgi:hypothetical protein
MALGSSEYGTVMHTLAGLLIVVHCNISLAKWLLNTGECALLVQLLCNFSFLIAAPLFAQTVPLYFFDLPVSLLVQLVAFEGTLQFYCSSLLVEVTSGARLLPIRRPRFCMHSYRIYRLSISLLLLFSSVFFQSNCMVYIGFVGLEFFASTLISRCGRYIRGE